MRRYPASHLGHMMSDFHIGGLCAVDSQHSSPGTGPEHYRLNGEGLWLVVRGGCVTGLTLALLVPLQSQVFPDERWGAFAKKADASPISGSVKISTSFRHRCLTRSVFMSSLLLPG
jgi:hypothetical protein